MSSQKSKHKTKCLVIDTSVARAAGSESEHPISKYCRDFLNGVLKICHRLVMTKEILDEWKEHRSLFAMRWHSAMVAKKKVVDFIKSNVKDEDLRKEIFSAAASDRDRKEMEKDLHLIEAALATDHIVVSLDETAKECFAKAAQRVGRLGEIIWINPHQDDDALECLKNPKLMEKHLLA